MIEYLIHKVNLAISKSLKMNSSEFLKKNRGKE